MQWVMQPCASDYHNNTTTYAVPRLRQDICIL